MTRFLFFSELLTKIGLCATIPVNLILIYLTAFHTKHITGTYKHMLIFFAISCILFATLEHVARPFTHNYNGSFLYFSLNDYMGFSQRFLQYAIAVYAGFYSMNVAFIAVQFVFRYWTLNEHWGLRSFRGKGKIIWGVYLLLVMTFYGGPILVFLEPNEWSDEYVREDFMSYYNKDISEFPRFAIIPYEHFNNSSPKRFRLENVSFLFFAVPILTFQYIVVIYCGIRMKLDMEHKLKNFSGTNRALQIQFFRALVVQIVVPTFLYSVPAIPVLMLPLFDIEISIQSGLVIGLFSVYPPIDSLALMLIVSEYRRSVKKIVGKFRKNAVQNVSNRETYSISRREKSSNNI